MAKRPKLTLEAVTLDMVKISKFGCTYCMWAGCECKHYERFVPALTPATFGPQAATCTGYCYYD